MINQEKKCCVVIPFHGEKLSHFQKLSVKSIKNKLQSHHIFFVGPKKIKKAFFEFEDTRTKYKFFQEHFFKSIKSYNRLLLSSTFYEQFSKYEYILIAQTDCLIFSKNLNEWCNMGYSYVGAPWFNGFSKPTKPLTFLGVGNGGLSLRKVNDFLSIFSMSQYFKKNNNLFGFIKLYIILSIFRFKYLNFGEDRFWGIVAGKYSSFFKVPDPLVAANFSIEVEPQYLCNLIGQMPFGCHAWERYDKEYWIKQSGILKKK